MKRYVVTLAIIGSMFATHAQQPPAGQNAHDLVVDPSLHQLSQDAASAAEGVVPEGREAVSKISIHNLALGTPVVGFDTGRIECTPRADKFTKRWCKSQNLDDTYHHGFVDVYKGKSQAVDFIITEYDHASAIKDFRGQIQTIENQYGPSSGGCYECGKVSWTFKARA